VSAVVTAVPATRPLPAGLVILGPTGCGKSALAMRVARQLPVEIISVDSAQVYRGLDIGTAKPSPDEQREVPHHLLDIRDPEESYSAGQFCADATRLVREIAARGRVPLLVGGTMLYYRALFRGLAELPVADAALRRRIDARAARDGWPALHAQLSALDPAAATRIHQNDAQRIQRALEVAMLSGRPLAEIWAEGLPADDFAGWTVCVLEPANRKCLHQLLAQRLDTMLEAGFVAEVRRLLSRDTLSEDSHILRLVGYRQLVAHARGQESLQLAVSRALAATRQLAKRQLTWLRSDKLLPTGANVLRGDPFDQTAMARNLEALIHAGRPP
jgi:tRNA dimethylallyltransferase